ncbi:MAG TPA: hypothetical protein VNN17_02655 [Terriglobia bacterium]|nr:hypothetical protein [Terriglobia bacterium]
MPQRFAIVLTFLLAGVAAPLASAADLKPATRMAILRGLVAEYAVLRTPLPRGEKGLRLSTNGAIDREALLHELTQQGTAVPAQVMVQITRIDFRDKEIVFEINGGGKKKTKWYEHIEIGMGTRTTPINNPNADQRAGTGSQITLRFPAKLPEMTVEEIKAYLSPVLDFEAKSPILTMTEPVPPEFQKAIEDKVAVVGMNRDMVLAAMGPPDRKVREEKDGVEQEDWIYGSPPLKVTFVTFEGEEVVDVQEYTGGVRGETYPFPAEPPR